MTSATTTTTTTTPSSSIETTPRLTPRQIVRLFESNFLKYLSIYDGVVRTTITDEELEIASTVFEDQINLVCTVVPDNTRIVGREQLKRMMHDYLESGTRFELLEVHLLRNHRSRRSIDFSVEAINEVTTATTDPITTAAAAATAATRRSASATGTATTSPKETIRIQYSARMIQANGDSKIGTSRVTLGHTGHITTIYSNTTDMDITTTTARGKNANTSTTNTTADYDATTTDCHTTSPPVAFHLVGFAKSKVTPLVTPIFR